MKFCVHIERKCINAANFYKLKFIILVHVNLIHRVFDKKISTKSTKNIKSIKSTKV